MYIPGLGDGYDHVRRRALRGWQRSTLVVTFVPMRWHDPTETYGQKLARIDAAIDRHTGSRLVVVGESAGGAMAVEVTARHPEAAKVITICGKTVRADRVASRVYRRNPAFKEAMIRADKRVASMSRTAASKFVTFYSPLDPTIRLIDTQIPGTRMRRLLTPGHLVSIVLVLLFLKPIIIKEALR